MVFHTSRRYLPPIRHKYRINILKHFTITPHVSSKKKRFDYLGFGLFSSMAVFTTGLSYWQWKRYYWKIGLKEAAESQLAESIIELPLNASSKSLSEFDLTNQRVFVTGIYAHENEMYMGPRGPFKDESSFDPLSPGPLSGGAGKNNSNMNAVSGFYLFTPLVRSDGSYVLINRGWVNMTHLEVSKRLDTLNEAPLIVSGVIQDFIETKPAYVPEADLSRKWFFWRDLEGMCEYLGRDTEREGFPIVIDATEEDPNSSTSIQRRPLSSFIHFNVEPHTHMIYGATWAALALIGYCMVFSKYGSILTRRRGVLQNINSNSKGLSKEAKDSIQRAKEKMKNREGKGKPI